MSGGYFDYVQYRITQAADDVAGLIQKVESSVEDEYGYGMFPYSPETLARFRECEAALRKAGAMLQRVDWLVSGDDSEGRFHSRWEEEVPK